MTDELSPHNANPSLVLLARLVRPQGRHGEILADILTDFPERFADRKRLFLIKSTAKLVALPREVSLERHWLHKGRVVLKFTGIDSINDAELLRGMEVAIPIEERAALADEAVYIDDLIGCRVFDFRAEFPSGAGTEVGEIVEVDRESTAHPLLVVRGLDAEEVLIPFVKAFLIRVDLHSRRIEMNLPEGLIELNAPLSPEEKARHLTGQSQEEAG
jgi:16S rRNA processing protein RimM